MALFTNSPVLLLPYFGFRSSERLVLKARALRSGRHNFQGGGRLRAIRTMLAQFASREVAGLLVTLEFSVAGTPVSHDAVTDAEGYVSFDLPIEPKWELPDHPAWDCLSLSWHDGGAQHSTPTHVLAPGKDSVLGVISDIDDTIIETGITGGLRSLARNWRRILAQWPEERIAVPGADVFYSALGGGEAVQPSETHCISRMAATHRPFFYVSSSPWNLFSYLVAFKRAKDLPLGPLMLRDWGLNRETFGSGSHGTHKETAIRRILATYPAMRFALIGDNTQGDLPAFSAIATSHPGRIAAIFLREASLEPHSADEEAAQSAIEQAGIPLWMGPSYEEGHTFLATLGLEGDHEAEEIVKAVEKAS